MPKTSKAQPAPVSTRVIERFQSGIRLCGPPSSRGGWLSDDLEVQDPALPARVLVLVDIHLASESQFFCGLSGDVADDDGGLFLSTYRSFAVGTSVDLEISLPEVGATVRARGEVRWVREHSAHEPRGIGIALEDLTLEDRRCIREFCDMRPALYYDDVG
jgi:uncharacterized protein (TIGR02266 family)